MTIRTIRCKLLVSSEVDPLFLATQEAFTNACNAILAKALEANVKDPIQLQQFVVYKAKRLGIAVEFVNPAYTSQVCFQCRQPGDRCKDVFQCKTCGEMPADYNASGNISIGGAVVNQPKLTICVKHIS